MLDGSAVRRATKPSRWSSRVVHWLYVVNTEPPISSLITSCSVTVRYVDWRFTTNGGFWLADGSTWNFSVFLAKAKNAVMYIESALRVLTLFGVAERTILIIKGVGFV